jgi:plastocyanin
MRALAVLTAALLLIGCPGNRRGEDESRNAPGQTSTSNPHAIPEKSPTMNPVVPPQATLGNQRPPAAAPQIEVQLTEYEIQMPDTIAAGRQTFHVTNAGKLNHNFAIEGNGFATKLSYDLTRGDSTPLTVDLKPGSYTVYCPVDKHRGRGMQRTITVK